ncbi:MAG: hypothetical protein ABI681_05310 [Gemmatimonadales bacterium]
MRTSFVRSVALIALFGESLAAQALGTPGTIMGIKVIPADVTIYRPVIVSVAGFGECGQVLLSFGDGSSTTLTSVKFPPRSQPHLLKSRVVHR